MALRIERMGSDAVGIAHDGDRTVLVRGALPGELVTCRITEERKGFSAGEAEEILEPSPLRREPVCPYYGKCGGCSFQIVSEKDSAALKAGIVRDNLRRIGHVEELPEFSVFHGSFHGYRHRARFHVDPAARKWGFLGRRSSSIIPIDSCPALSPRLNALLSDGRQLLGKGREAMFSNRMDRNTGFAEVSAFEGDDEVSLGSEPVRITAGDVSYLVSAAVFFQSNPSVLPHLLSFVKENAIGESIMDLYSGVGTFSALFEGSGKRIYAVEREKQCLALSRQNAPSALSFTADVAAWGRKSGRHVETVIVDPPRTGIAPEAISQILSWKPERIIYVSCSSATLSRDVGLMDGYSVTRAAVFDFYPGTGHDETALVLDRGI